MKKLLVLLLVLVLAFSFAACGSDNGENGGDNSTPTANTGNNNSNGGEEQTGYVGTWKKENTADAPFKMTLVLNADGTGKMGNDLTRKETEDGKIEITLIYDDDLGEGDAKVGYITESGTLWLEMDMQVEGTKYDHIEFKRQ